MCAALLVVSVLVLSFVLLLEKGLVTTVDKGVLQHAQMALFALGIFLLLIGVAAEEDVHSSFESLKGEVSRRWFFRDASGRLEEARETIEVAVSALEVATGKTFMPRDNEARDRRAEEARGGRARG